MNRRSLLIGAGVTAITAPFIKQTRAVPFPRATHLDGAVRLSNGDSFTETSAGIPLPITATCGLMAFSVLNDSGPSGATLLSNTKWSSVNGQNTSYYANSFWQSHSPGFQGLVLGQDVIGSHSHIWNWTVPNNSNFHTTVAAWNCTTRSLAAWVDGAPVSVTSILGTVNGGPDSGPFTVQYDPSWAWHLGAADDTNQINGTGHLPIPQSWRYFTGDIAFFHLFLSNTPYNLASIAPRYFGNGFAICPPASGIGVVAGQNAVMTFQGGPLFIEKNLAARRSSWPSVGSDQLLWDTPEAVFDLKSGTLTTAIADPYDPTLSS